MTREDIMGRFEQAIWVFRFLPRVGPAKNTTYWPEIIFSAQELMMQEPMPMRIRPTTEQITLAEEVLTWGKALTEQQRQAIWIRASRFPWRVVCIRLGVSRTQANTIVNKGLDAVLDLLSKS